MALDRVQIYSSKSFRIFTVQLDYNAFVEDISFVWMAG